MKGLKAFSTYLLICVTILFSLAGCTSYQSIRFESAPVTESSTVIKGTLYRPDGNGFFPAVIVLHGCGGVDYNHRKWAEQLVEWGYVALIVDSFSPRGVDKVCGNPYRVSPIERALDAYGAADYLKQQPYIDRDNIGLLGFSHGGFTGMRAIQKNFVYAAKMEAMPFKAGVLFYPWCDSIQDQVDIPTLIMIGSKDDWTPAARCVETKKKLSNPDLLDLIVFEGAYHGFDRPIGNKTYLGHHIVHNPDATKIAKDRTKHFLDDHLFKK